VARSELHRAGAERRFDRLVRDDRNGALHERQQHRLAHERSPAIVARVHGDAGVAEHRLRTRGGHGDESARLAEHGVADVPELAPARHVLDLVVGHGGAQRAVPVHEPCAAVDETLLPERHERRDDRAAHVVVERELRP
jgi:hypothetical protein